MADEPGHDHAGPAASAAHPGGGHVHEHGSGEAGPEEQVAMAEQLAELRSQLLATPAEVVVANHAYGLFELAAIHLSQRPPALNQARLAIDAMAALVESLAGRLGEVEEPLRDALAQIRMAFVQISNAGDGEHAAVDGEQAAGTSS